MTDDNSLPVAFGFDLDVSATDQDVTISAAVTASATVTLSGLTVVVDGIAQGLKIVINPGADPMLSLSAEPSGPTGGAATVDLPAISGHGELQVIQDKTGTTWVGALLLQLSTFSVDAFAVISAGPSFVIVLCARFPAPGIQVGFGFAVSGVGGVFGLNRRSDPDALIAATMDGSISGLLFPSNAADDAQRVIHNLPALFPDCPGQLIVGPMLEITWAGGLLTAEVMVLLEMPKPLVVSVLGRLALDLPADGAAIVHIEARVYASVIPSIPEFRLAVSLSGSSIAGFPLTGDMFLLIRGGPDSTFVFSAGGFHPLAIPPPNVPPMQRLGMAMSLSFIELRCESYLALTTSSVQLGAQVELSAEVDDCGIHGSFGFDALIEWKPQFHLRVDVHVSLSVEVFGEHLCGVNFDGFLEGPQPWHLNGRGEVELFFVSVSIPIDATFGSGPPALTETPRVGALLAAELAKPSSWTIHPPAAGLDGVTLSQTAQAQVAAAAVLHPLGGLQVVQHLVPFDMVIDRFGGHAVPEQSWQISGIVLGAATAVDWQVTPVPDDFADGTFTTLTVEQQLTTNGFTSHAAGVEVAASDLQVGPKVTPPPDRLTPLDIPIDFPAPANSPAPVLADLAALVPQRTAAIAFTRAGNPITALTQPPLATVSAAAPAFSLARAYRLELWETQ
jgi:hypothetical protein